MDKNLNILKFWRLNKPVKGGISKYYNSHAVLAESENYIDEFAVLLNPVNLPIVSNCFSYKIIGFGTVQYNRCYCG